MNTSIQLANRFREVLLNGTWIANTNFKDQLMQVAWEESIVKVGSLNTIAGLTNHINYYIDGIVRFFENGTLDISDKRSFDAKSPQTEQEWENVRNTLFANAERFVHHVDKMISEQLEANFVDEKYGTYARNIEAMIEHCYYHLGQIVLLRKMIAD